jgi:hypothetical protein
MAQQELPPSNLPPIDWDRWLGWHIQEQQVRDHRREPFLDAAMYRKRVGSIGPGMHKVTSKVPAQIEPGVDALFVATRRRLWDVLNWLCLQYSAGAPVDQIREVWPYAMRWAEEYAMFHEAHHLDPHNKGGIVPHAALRTEDYWTVALRLLCFGLLTGHAHEVPRVMRFLDYGNDLMGVRDGLIERLVAPFVPGRGTPPDEATRHLPYRRLFKVFAAESAERPALMAKYLEGWYEGSRREPYFEQHLEGGFGFYGYWSWEAAAVTWLLGIDDTSYRSMRFYPADLADFAKAFPPPGAGTATAVALRCDAGQPCPREGWWITPAKADSRRYFEAGEIMPAFESDYGTTIWQWDDKQAG